MWRGVIPRLLRLMLKLCLRSGRVGYYYHAEVRKDPWALASPPLFVNQILFSHLHKLLEIVLPILGDSAGILSRH